MWKRICVILPTTIGYEKHKNNCVKSKLLKSIEYTAFTYSKTC